MVLIDDNVSELLKTCEILQASSNDLCSLTERLIQEIQHDSNPFQPQGLSILELKNDLLLSYLTNTIYIILKKCSNATIESDKAIERLVEMQVILKKLNPIEQKLKHHIEKLMKGSVNTETDYKSNLKANPEDMASVSDPDGDSEGEVKELRRKKASGLYVAPKLAAVPYDGDNEATKQQKILERAKKRALNSSLIQELKEEYLHTPVEMSYTNTLRNKRMKFEEDKQRFEEEYFVRLPVTKKEKQRNKLLSSCTLGKLGTDITHFDDISALEGRVSQKQKKRTTLMKRKKK